MDSAKGSTFWPGNDVSLEPLHGSVFQGAPLGVISTIAELDLKTGFFVMNITLADSRILKRSLSPSEWPSVLCHRDQASPIPVSAYQTASTGADIMMRTMGAILRSERTWHSPTAAEGLCTVKKLFWLLSKRARELCCTCPDLLWASCFLTADLPELVA